MANTYGAQITASVTPPVDQYGEGTCTDAAKTQTILSVYLAANTVATIEVRMVATGEGALYRSTDWLEWSGYRIGGANPVQTSDTSMASSGLTNLNFKLDSDSEELFTLSSGESSGTKSSDISAFRRSASK